MRNMSQRTTLMTRKRHSIKENAYTVAGLYILSLRAHNRARHINHNNMTLWCKTYLLPIASWYGVTHAIT